MKNNIVLIILTYFVIPNYAGALSGSGNNDSTSNQNGACSNLNPVVAIVIIVLFGALFLMTIISICLRQCSSEAPAPATYLSYPARIVRLGTPSGSNHNRRQGLDPAVINSFPILSFVSVKELKSGRVSGASECAVCLSAFEGFDSIKLLPQCNHVFHPKCIDTWLASHVTCPVCRVNLELKLDPASCPRCGRVSNIRSRSSSSVSNNMVTNSVLSESNLQQPQRQPQASVSVAVKSENREEEQEGEGEERRRISGKLMRSHSTGHSLALQQVNMERDTSRIPEKVEIPIQDEKESMRRCSSYHVVMDLGISSSSSRSESGVSVGAPPVGGGTNGKGLFTSVKVPFSFLGLKFDGDKQWANRPPV